MAQGNPFDGPDSLWNAFFPPGQAPPAPTAGPAGPKVTIDEIIRRGVCHVMHKGKLYRIEVKEIER